MRHMVSVIESCIFSLEKQGFSVLYWYIGRGEVEVILKTRGVSPLEAVNLIRRKLRIREINLEITKDGKDLLARISFKLGHPPRGLRPKGLNDILVWGPAI